MELSGIGAAWVEAHSSADDLAREATKGRSGIGPWTVEFSDQTGITLGSVEVKWRPQLN